MRVGMRTVAPIVLDLVARAGELLRIGDGEFAHPEDEETPLVRATLRKLADYVEEQMRRGNRISLFACWAGDEGAPAEHRRVVRLDDLRNGAFWFLEKEASTFAAC